MPTSIGPVIKVDGEKEYRASMKNIITTTKELDSELKATATSFDKNGKAQNTNAQKVEALKKKIELQKKAISEANDMCEKAKQKYGEDSVEAQKYQTQVNNLTAELNRMNNELEESGGSTLGAKLKDIGEGMKGVAEKGEKVGTALTKGVTGPIMGIATASMAAWKTVDDGMDKVATATGATGDALDGLQQSLTNVYKNSTLDMDTLSSALGEINSRFGYTGEQLESTTELFSEFAEINNDDVTSAVDSASKVMSQFGLSAEDTDGYLGLLTKTSQETGMSTGDLGKSLEKNGATLRAMGLDVGQSVTLMGNLSKAGFDDETAMKAMSKAAQKYSKDGKNAGEGMKNLIKGVQDGTISFEELSDVVGTKNAVAFQELAQSGALSLDNLSTDLNDYSGVVGETFTNTQDPIDNMQVVFHNLQVAGADLFNTIGTMLTPIIQTLADKAKALSDWWAGMSPETQQMIVKIAAIAAAIGPVILMISKVIGVVSMLMNPIGLVVTAIAGVTAAVVTLWNKNEAFREFITGLWNGLVNIATGIWDTITGLFSGEITVADVIHDAWDGLVGIASGIWDSIVGFFTSTINLKEIATTVWDNAQAAAETAWNAIVGFFEGAAPVVKDIATTAWTTAQTAAENAWNAIVSAWESLPPAVKDIATTVWTTAQSAAENAWNAIKTAWEGAAPVVKDIATTAWTTAQTVAENAWDAITTAWEGAAPVIKDIATTAWDNAKTAAGNIWDGICDIFSGDFPFPDIGKIASDAFGAVRDAAQGAWDWICDLFGGGEGEDLKTGEVDTSSISGATAEMEKSFQEVNLTISDVDVSSITEANQFVNNSVLSYKRMFDNQKLAFPTIGTQTLTTSKAAASAAARVITNSFTKMKLALPQVGTTTLTPLKNAVTTTTTFVKNAFSTMKLILPSVNTNSLTLLQTAAGNAATAVRAKISSMSLSLPVVNISSLNTMTSTAESKANSVKSSINNVSLKLPSVGVGALNTMKNEVDSALHAIKTKAENFKWKLARPQLPKATAVFTEVKSKDGKVSGYNLSYHTSWFDNGGVFYDPAVIGIAEKRPEFVGALDDLKDVVKAAMAESGSRSGATFNQYNYSPKPLSRLEIYRQTRNYVNLALG